MMPVRRWVREELSWGVATVVAIALCITVVPMLMVARLAANIEGVFDGTD